MDREIRALRAELAALREEVSLLRQRVIQLESEQGFEVVGTSTGSATGSGDTAHTGSSPAPLQEGERIAAARETGHFFKRCLAGGARGTSGRERVPLANRYYVLVRSLDNTITTKPVRVFKTYSALKPLVCASPNNFGDSIFAGFPSVWEAQLAVDTAGFTWPSSYE
eukprot:Skav202141  [mRNA]  locus=C8819082:37:537:- [translate_table: standard]